MCGIICYDLHVLYGVPSCWTCLSNELLKCFYNWQGRIWKWSPHHVITMGSCFLLLTLLFFVMFRISSPSKVKPLSPEIEDPVGSLCFTPNPIKIDPVRSTKPGNFCVAYYWYHTRCIGMSDAENQRLGSRNEGWCCSKCMKEAFQFLNSSSLSILMLVNCLNQSPSSPFPVWTSTQTVVATSTLYMPTLLHPIQISLPVRLG